MSSLHVTHEALRGAAPAAARPSGSIRAAIPAALAHRRASLVCAALATLLALPALSSGEVLDDYFHRALLRPEGPVPLATSDHGVFGFIDDDTARTEALTEAGVFPWWLGSHTRAAFFRPLSELTHRADHLLWPASPRAMHAHSLAWAALLVVVVGAFYRRFLGRTWLAGLATLLYALDDAHALPVAWIANRNAILATLFGVLAVMAHDRWRREGRTRWAPMAVIALLASLLSAEAGIATVAYLVAHAFFLDAERGVRRLFALAPHLSAVVIWRATSCALGYGAHGSGLYIDPLHDPLRFTEALALRAPVLLAGQWTPVPADVDGMLLASHRLPEAIAASIALAGLGWVIATRVKGDATTRFLAAGMLLSVVPICATFPSDRLLFFVGIGAMGLIARALPVLLADRSRGVRVVGVGLLAVHLAVAPLAFPVRADTPRTVGRYLDGCTRVPDGAEGRNLVLVNALDSCTAYLPLRAGLDGRRAPASARTLTSGVVPITLVREDERSLRVEREGGWFTTTFEMVFWDPEHRFTVGEHRVLDGMDAEVRAITDDGRPRAVRFRFEVPLEDTSLLFVRVDRDGALVPVSLPAPGESLALDPVYP